MPQPQQGPQGPIGPTGPPGPIGPTGDATAIEARVTALEVQTAALEDRVTALEQGESVPPELLTKDFNAAVELGGCGCSDPTDPNCCWAAAIEWRNFVVANPGAELMLIAATYNMDFSTLIASDPNGNTGRYPDAHRIPSCTITAEPETKFENFTGLGVYGGQSTQVKDGGFIATVAAGATSVTLLNSTDASHFTIGRWVCVCGIALQSFGFPTNFQRYEFHQVTGISGAVITLDSALRQSFSQTWPNNIDVPTSGGAACLITMGAGWDITQTVENVEMLHSDQGSGTIGIAVNPFRSMTFTNCIFTETAPGGSYNQELIFTGCTMSGYAAEIDKCVETIIYDNCTINGHLNIQSASPHNLHIRNGTIITYGFNNCQGKNCTISDSTISNLMNTGPGYGRAETLIITNSTVPAFVMATHGIVPDLLACMTYLGSGLWKFGSDDYNRALNFEQAIVPGYQYAFAYQTGDADIYPDPQFTTPPIYFCITDISATIGTFNYNYLIQTDMPYAADALPTSTFNTKAWNGFQAIPYTSITIDGVAQVGGFAATQICEVLINDKIRSID